MMAVQSIAALQPPCPHRCFLVSVDEIIRDDAKYPSGASLRLMGVVVSLVPSSGGGDDASVVLDDGTALVSLKIPASMMERILQSVKKSLVGRTLDCVVRITTARDLCANQVVLIQDAHAETLRWFELSFSVDGYSTEFGYPNRDVLPDDLFEMIQYECSDDADPPGVALEHLALLFQLDHVTIEKLIQELQLSGQIYRNQEGLYLPL